MEEPTAHIFLQYKDTQMDKENMDNIISLLVFSGLGLFICI